MQTVGYARSTLLDEDLEHQRQSLASAGCGVIFEHSPEMPSSNLLGLEAALTTIHTGDTLVVCSLDKLGMSVQNVIDRILQLHCQGIGFRSLSEGIDLTGPAGAMQFRLLAGFARAQNRLELEQGYAALQARSAREAKRGPKHKLSKEDVERAVKAVVAGEQTVVSMAKLLGVGRNTLSRALSRRPDYLRLTKAQIAEAEKLAEEIEASAERMIRRMDATIEKIDRVTSADYIAERERAVREELAANPVEFDPEAVQRVLAANASTFSR